MKLVSASTWGFYVLGFFNRQCGKCIKEKLVHNYSITTIFIIYYFITTIVYYITRATNPPGPEMVLIGPKNSIMGLKIVLLRILPAGLPTHRPRCSTHGPKNSIFVLIIVWVGSPASPLPSTTSSHYTTIIC